MISTYESGQEEETQSSVTLHDQSYQNQRLKIIISFAQDFIDQESEKSSTQYFTFAIGGFRRLMEKSASRMFFMSSFLAHMTH